MRFENAVEFIDNSHTRQKLLPTLIGLFSAGIAIVLTIGLHAMDAIEHAHRF